MDRLKALFFVRVLVGFAGGLALLTSYDVQAAGNSSYVSGANSSYDPIIMPELFSTSVILDDDEQPPREPNISQVDFVKPPPVTGFPERVDRLVYGIRTSVPPKYDHYGHEIRRYMAHIGDLRIFEKDKEYLGEQIKNVRKARVIADYWQDYLEQEIRDIEAFIDKNTSLPLAALSTFKQNKATVRSFFISLKGWIETNERFLSQIWRDTQHYDVFYPEIVIAFSQARVDFYNTLLAKQTKLKGIREYEPFTMMVY